MDKRQVVELAHNLPTEHMMLFMDTWMATHKDDLTAKFGLELLDRVTRTLLIGLDNDMALLKDHAADAEAALVILSARKRDWSNAAAIIAKFMPRAFFSWDWFIKKYGAKP